MKTSIDSRDPRLDPQRGDLSHDDGTYWLVLARTPITVTFVETCDSETVSLATITLEKWILRSKTDEVLHVAE